MTKKELSPSKVHQPAIDELNQAVIMKAEPRTEVVYLITRPGHVPDFFDKDNNSWTAVAWFRQSPGGTISVVVEEESGAVAPGAEVTITNLNLNSRKRLYEIPEQSSLA